ncbi:MAG: asparagine synthase (glutamine-hydrolyzing) [Bacteroidia bacterium]|nr:asparagine synthase (glutamine-hydrolyzing) [Bacteroidia bacterium]
MCGISLLVNKTLSNAHFDDIHTMNETILHRGPDAGNTYVYNNVALGHRRLAIIDLSVDGEQPMHWKDKYTIIFNGEIYNYIEIKNDLESKGYIFSTKTDTEVILAAYDCYKEDCLNYFNGMWAFVIIDKQSNSLFGARDRFGVKPFHYCIIDKYFACSSEIKQLLTIVPAVANEQIVVDFLSHGIVEHKEETFFKSIFKLLPSTYFVYNLTSNKITFKKYYEILLRNEILNYSLEESINVYEKTLESAIKLRMRSDVKVGTCLSGGLDSSTIAAIASKMSNGKFTAITASSTDKRNDETNFAKEVVQHCNLDWKTICPTTTVFFNNIAEIIKTQEEPFASTSIFMQYFVMKSAKENGCTVLLDGQGGDETLFGYERYYASLFKHLSFIDKIKTFRAATKNSKLTAKTLVAYLFYFNNFFIRKLFLKKRSAFLKPNYINKIDFSIIKDAIKSNNNVVNLQILEITKTTMPQLLKYEDRNSMRHSIETRLPFIDYNCVEVALSINNNYKIYNGWTKYILRNITQKHLPSSIAWRKNKVGFESPQDEWLKNKNYFLPLIKSSLLLKKITKTDFDFETISDNNLFWKLYCVAAWEKEFILK